MEITRWDIVKSFYEYITMGISPATMVINLMTALVISLFIYIIYRKTYSGVAYAKNYNISLVLTCLVTAMAMMMLRSNVALSLGTLGVLSIIRFRNAVKEPKDISFMFWAIIAGLCAGTSAYVLAVVGSVIIAIVLLIFSSASENYLSYLLVINGNKYGNDDAETIIKKYTKRYKVKTKNIERDSKQYMYEICLKKNSDESLIEALDEVSGITNVKIIAYNNDIGR